MKVQLVVVRGKPEGKVIPLVGPNFKIGRGETCHLRPNSEQVSREHAEFTIDGDSVMVRDLGSRNGTLVNGKALTADVPAQGPRPGASGAADLRGLDRGCARGQGGRRGPAAPGGRQGQVTRMTSRPTTSIRGWSAEAAASRRATDGRLRRRHDHDHRLQGRQAAAPPSRSRRPRPPATTNTSGSPRKRSRWTRRPRPPRTSRARAAPRSSMTIQRGRRGRRGGAGEEEAVPEEFLDESNPFYAAKKAQKEQAKQGRPVPPSRRSRTPATRPAISSAD